MQKYRLFLKGISYSVKLNYYYKMLGLDHSNMTKFMQGNDKVVNIKKLELLTNYIKNDLRNLIENDA